MPTSRTRRVLRHLLAVLHQLGKGAALSALPMVVLPSRVAEQSVSPYGWTLAAPVGPDPAPMARPATVPPSTLIRLPATSPAGFRR